MATLTKIRFDPATQERYKKLKERTGISMKAITAECRKLLILIYALYVNETVYDPDYGKTAKNKKTVEPLSSASLPVCTKEQNTATLTVAGSAEESASCSDSANDETVSAELFPVCAEEQNTVTGTTAKKTGSCSDSGNGKKPGSKGGSTDCRKRKKAGKMP
jgi:hypothetical protein